MAATSALCPTPSDRARLVEMETRFARPRLVVWATMTAGILVGLPWLGVWPLLLLVPVALNFLWVARRVPRSARPEYLLFWAIIANQIGCGLAIVATGGPHSDLMPMLLFAVASLAVRFNPRAAAVGTGATLVILFAATAGADWDAFVAWPVTASVIALVIVGVAVFSSTVMRSELEKRTEAIVDPLTGLLNRKALEQRFAEIRTQTADADESVAVVVADIDHFKQVNDTHGHDAGDRVLVAVADAMRTALRRSFELVYRVGGEEFVVLLPGAGTSQATALAERLRRAVESATPAGHRVTLSVGVAARPHGDLDFDALYKAADEALYHAKRAGRNRVSTAKTGRPAPVAVPLPQPL